MRRRSVNELRRRRAGCGAEPSGPRLRTLAVLHLCLLLLAGCSGEALLRSEGRLWLWSLAPVALFALVQGPGLALDRRRLARRGDRVAGRLYLAGLLLVVAATIAFVACNLAVEMPPEGKLANVAAWFAGAVVAAVGGGLVDRRAALATKEAPPVRPIRRRSR